MGEVWHASRLIGPLVPGARRHLIANPETAWLGTDNAPGTYVLRSGTLATRTDD